MSAVETKVKNNVFNGKVKKNWKHFTVLDNQNIKHFERN